MVAKINSIPYFLFFNNQIKIDVNVLKPANKYFIIAIKYFPLIAILLAFGSIPNTIGELYLFGFGSALAIIFGFIFVKFLNWLKESILVFSIIAFCAVWFKLLDPIYFDSALFYCMQSLIILYLVYDAFFIKSYQHYYIATNTRKYLKVKSERKKRPLLSFGKREFLHIKQGFDFDFDMKLNGFYIHFNENEVQNETLNH